MEAFGKMEEAPSEDDRRRADPIGSQRNVPREMANAITKSPPLRFTVWQVKRLPNGTQATRLMRLLEDKGWRRMKVSGRDLLVHGRSFKFLEPTEVRDWTLAGVYSILRPRTSDDERDPRAVDSGLLRLWGVRYALGGSDGQTSARERPSEEFLDFVSDAGNMGQAEQLADMFFQHTGIVVEPLGAVLPRGKVERGREEAADLRGRLTDLMLARAHSTDPEETEELDRKIGKLKRRIASRTDRETPGPELPPGVDPDDVVVAAEGGRMYVMRARRQPDMRVIHDSSGLIASGRATAVSRGPEGRLAHAADSERGTDPDDLGRRIGGRPSSPDGPTSSPMVRTPQGVSVPKAWLDQRPKASTPSGPEGPSVRIQGDGTLSKAVDLARSEGRTHLYLVPTRSGKGPDRIPVTPVPFGYERGGLVSELDRVASSLRATGGLPVRPGRWSTDDLGKYLRMFERDTGARL